MLQITRTGLSEVLILEYDRTNDNRGVKCNVFSKRELLQAGITDDFVEETVYCPEKTGTLYGIHFQNNPKAQSKLLACITGRGLDYAVDLRRDSETYKKWICVELSGSNGRQLYIPKGFGHAFLSLEADTRILFRIDQYFDPQFSRSISYKDNDLNITFPVENPVLSKQDTEAPFLKDSDCNF